MKRKMKTSRQFLLGELFCGAGGMSLGALKVRSNNGEKSQFKLAWALDSHLDSCLTLKTNLMKFAGDKKARVVCADVRKVNLDAFTKHKIDGLSFGFPCNDFSQVGESKGLGGNFGNLYEYGVKALKKFQPKFFVAENVKGLGGSKHKDVLQMILKKLRSVGAGYRINAHLYKFEDYGVPQTRHRILLVGIRSDLKLKFETPAPTHISKWISAKEAIERRPIPSFAKNNELATISEIVRNRLIYTPPGGNAWNSPIPKKWRLNGVKAAFISQIYKRLDPKKPAYTITGSGGGGTHVYHWKEPRPLTNREKARLQSFPDWFEFVGGRESVRRQVGMAVPPKMAKIIFSAVAKTFRKDKYKTVEAKIVDDPL